MITVSLLFVTLFTCISLAYLFFFSKNEITPYQFPLQQRWELSVENQIRSTPVVYNNRVLIRTVDKLYAINAQTGEIMWSVVLPKDWHAAPPIVQDNVVVVSHSQGTTALDFTTGEYLWEKLDEDTRSDTYPAISNEDVVVIVDSAILIRDIKTGKLLWKIQNPYARSDAIVVKDKENLYIIFRDEIRSYDIRTGNLNWSHPTEEWSLQIGSFDDEVFYLQGRRDDGIAAYSLDKQTTLWHTDDVNPSVYPMAKYENILVIGTKGCSPVALNATTGDILWVADGVWSLDTYQTPLIVDNIIYIRSLYGKNIYAINKSDGKVIGYLKLGMPDIVSSNADYSLGPVQYNGLIIFPAGNRLLAYGK
jgi:outer membrane protein assembly factor BamB